MPVTLNQYIGGENISDYNKIDMGRFLSWTDFPVYSIPAEIFDFTNESQLFNKRSGFHEKDHLFDLSKDYDQNVELEDAELESRMQNMMIEKLKETGLPEGAAGAAWIERLIDKETYMEIPASGISTIRG